MNKREGEGKREECNGELLFFLWIFYPPRMKGRHKSFYIYAGPTSLRFFYPFIVLRDFLNVYG